MTSKNKNLHFLYFLFKVQRKKKVFLVLPFFLCFVLLPMIIIIKNELKTKKIKLSIEPGTKIMSVKED